MVQQIFSFHRRQFSHHQSNRQNEYEFVEKIIQLLNDLQLQNLFKINARNFVEANYSWDKANRILEDILLE